MGASGSNYEGVQFTPTGVGKTLAALINRLKEEEKASWAAANAALINSVSLMEIREERERQAEQAEGKAELARRDYYIADEQSAQAIKAAFRKTKEREEAEQKASGVTIIGESS